MSDKNTTLDLSATDPRLLSGLVDDERWVLIIRIASAPSFKKSPRLRQFLLFVAERSLTGHSEEISEQNIGWRVFERKPDYNPSDDSIVRTTARQLRARVKEYFDKEGRNEDWILEIPKGHYTPIFIRRDTVAEAETTAAPPSSITSVVHRPPSITRVSTLVALIAVCSSAIAYQLGRRFPHPSLASSQTILSSILEHSQESTPVIVGDYGAILMSTIIGRPVSVEEYANRTGSPAFAEDERGQLLHGLWTHFGEGRMVPLGDVGVAGSIAKLSAEERKKITIEHARQITVRDLRSGNLILLNTPPANPWVNLFQDSLNFRYHRRVDPGQPGRPEFLNTNPLPGEALSYVAAPTTPEYGISYGLVARVSNLTNTGKVLLIMGLRFTGGEAAGDYATDPAAAAELARFLNVRNIKDAPDFEVLLQTHSLASAPRDVKVVAFRRH